MIFLSEKTILVKRLHDHVRPLTFSNAMKSHKPPKGKELLYHKEDKNTLKLETHSDFPTEYRPKQQ